MGFPVFFVANELCTATTLRNKAPQIATSDNNRQQVATNRNKKTPPPCEDGAFVLAYWIFKLPSEMSLPDFRS